MLVLMSPLFTGRESDGHNERKGEKKKLVHLNKVELRWQGDALSLDGPKPWKG
jgi:hypothetical protein